MHSPIRRVLLLAAVSSLGLAPPTSAQEPAAPQVVEAVKGEITLAIDPEAGLGLEELIKVTQHVTGEAITYPSEAVRSAPAVKLVGVQRVQRDRFLSFLKSILYTRGFVVRERGAGDVRLLEVVQVPDEVPPATEGLRPRAGKQAGTVSLSLADEEVRVAIDALAQEAGFSYVVGPRVRGAVTLRMNDVPWRAALDAMVETLGFHIEEDEHGILRIH